MFYYVIESLSERLGGGKKPAPAGGSAAPAAAHAKREGD
jgi:hypothetical protein